jgi:DNA-binding NtrC family response regulator
MRGMATMKPEEIGRNRKKKVLIIDDNEDLASVIAALLEFDGYEVRLARDSNNGYQAYIFFQPHLVITDIQMPGKNGLELIGEIRAHDPKVKTIYMSADLGRFHALLEDEIERYQVVLLKKPFSTTELRGLLSKLLSDAVDEKSEV